MIKKEKQSCDNTTSPQKYKQAHTKRQILWYMAQTFQMSGIQKGLQKMWKH